MTFMTFAQSVTGKWINVDENGLEKSVIHIYEESEKIYGKIIDILDPNDQDALCDKCLDDEYNQPILGLNIIKDLSYDGAYYRGGTIFDPEKGKTYKCRLALEKGNPDVLEVRSYVAFMYETQYWKRVK
ncbi:MAG: DUF2147 domain-containing protein [Flavobacteriaceae bacterium]|nr:MAG: DUF2147 domain-containing protein [Flavobacteriaceae bacterium]